MKLQRKPALAAVLAVAALLGACSGGDDDGGGPPITQQVPASAGDSPEAFMAAVQAIVNADADLLEPSDISAIADSTTVTTDTQDPLVDVTL